MNFVFTTRAVYEQTLRRRSNNVKLIDLNNQYYSLCSIESLNIESLSCDLKTAEYLSF